MLKVVVISDTHGLHDMMDDLPDGDLLIHAGDITNVGYKTQAEYFMQWFSEQPHKYKIFIAGNHDFFLENGIMGCSVDSLLKEFPNIIYLQDSAVEIEGIKIYGSPWTPRFYNWAFMKDRGKPIEEVWAAIPEDTDILITHGPPLGFGDRTLEGERVGCKELLERIQVIKPKFNIFGHIHEGYGWYEKDGVNYVNASSVNRRYELVNPPVAFTYEDYL